MAVEPLLQLHEHGVADPEGVVGPDPTCCSERFTCRFPTIRTTHCPIGTTRSSAGRTTGPELHELLAASFDGCACGQTGSPEGVLRTLPGRTARPCVAPSAPAAAGSPHPGQAGNLPALWPGLAG